MSLQQLKLVDYAMIHRNEWRHHHEGETHKKNDRHKARRTLCETHHAPRKAVQFHDVILLKPRRCSSLLHSWLLLWRHFDIFGFSTPLEFYVSKQSISLCVSPRLAMLRSVPSRPHVKWLVNFFIKTKKTKKSGRGGIFFRLAKWNLNKVRDSENMLSAAPAQT